jgi:hypothetical protein
MDMTSGVGERGGGYGCVLVASSQSDAAPGKYPAATITVQK